MEKFREEIAKFTVHSWDFVRKMHGRTILVVACHVSHPSDISSTHKQLEAANKYWKWKKNIIHLEKANKNNSLIDCSLHWVSQAAEFSMLVEN